MKSLKAYNEIEQEKEPRQKEEYKQQRDQLDEKFFTNIIPQDRSLVKQRSIIQVKREAEEVRGRITVEEKRILNTV
jgi:hypothetical protein